MVKVIVTHGGRLWGLEGPVLMLSGCDLKEFEDAVAFLTGQTNFAGTVIHAPFNVIPPGSKDMNASLQWELLAAQVSDYIYLYAQHLDAPSDYEYWFRFGLYASSRKLIIQPGQIIDLFKAGVFEVPIKKFEELFPQRQEAKLFDAPQLKEH